VLWAALCLLLLTPSLSAAEYGFPLENPYRATVFGTPPADRAPLPEEVPVSVRSLDLHPDRNRSPVFWNIPSFRYSVALQEEPAPLVFVIAGTGARFDSQKNAYLQGVLYGAGMSVVNLSSPTHPDFVVAGSTSSVPGFMEQDIRDLYEAMQTIVLDLRDEAEITGFLVTGYSLGGTHAAFLGELDEREGAFGFERILMLNPAVSLYASVNRLDRFVVEGLPGGAPQLSGMVDEIFARVADAFHERRPGRIDEELLFQIGDASLSDPELQALIGVAFRISLARMLFSSDVVTGGGQLVDPDQPLTLGTPLLPYLKAGGRWSFADYLDDVLLPYWQERVPGTSRDEAIEAASLAAIDDYLIRAENVAVMHNEDDFILDAEEVDYLREIFGRRATLYPTGGHCGNLMYRDNVERMIAFLSGDLPEKRGEGTVASLPEPPDIEPAAGPLRRITPEEAAAIPGFLDVWDPLEGMNRRLYWFNARFDQYVFLPVVRGYEFVLPGFVRSGIHNVFTTVGEVTTLANSILQLRPRKSVETLGRLVVNLTVGVAGLWDPATRFGMPNHDENFAQTLGFYRVPAGPYLVVPILGPSSARGATGALVDAAPYFFLSIPPYVAPVGAVDTRAYTAFRYQQVGVPFEYETVRYLSRTYEELLIPR
jgi:ABC-type transporter lipoprotein component MlaA